MVAAFRPAVVSAVLAGVLEYVPAAKQFVPLGSLAKSAPRVPAVK